MSPYEKKGKKELESYIQTILQGHHDYTYVNPEIFESECELGRPIFTKQFRLPSMSLFNTYNKVDFILFHPDKHPNNLIIECKWQESRGSTEQKIVYTIANIKATYNYKTIVVLDGGGISKGAIQWTQSQPSENLLYIVNREKLSQIIKEQSLF